MEKTRLEKETEHKPGDGQNIAATFNEVATSMT